MGKLPHVVAKARRVATQVLCRVERDRAWATTALDNEIRRARLGPTDAALATQVVYGTLRTWSALETVVARHANRRVRVDPWTHAALLSGTFQLLHLGRVPPHAVVDEAVALVRDKRGARVAGFVNAVLRRVARERPDDPKPPIALAIPAWLDRALRDSIGDEDAEALLQLGEDVTTIDVRVPRRVDLDSVSASIAGSRPDGRVVPTKLSPRGLRLSRVGDPRRLSAYERGEIAVQEEGSQWIGDVLGAQPAERVLDVCAGRGGKTAQLVEAVGLEGEVVATDVHAARLAQIPDELARLGLPVHTLQTATVDWTVGPGGVEGSFDRVLVDAPCTGLGTLRRRPEILLRTHPDSATHMGEIQCRILEHAASRVRAGGTLVYAVCSPLVEEGASVLERASLPGFEAVSVPGFDLKSPAVGSTPCVRLGPTVEGASPWADAYQVFVWAYVG